MKFKLILSIKVGKTGKVIGIEHIPELAKQSILNIKRWNSYIVNEDVIQIIGIKKSKNKIK